MRWRVLFALAAVSLRAQGDERVRDILGRVAEEAEVFASVARNVIAEEKLVQRARKPPSRLRIRAGQGAMTPPKPVYQEREIVSEYAYGSFAEAPGVLHEFRQVLSVDGRKVLSAEKARRTLSVGLKSGTDLAKKQLLQGFARNTLGDAITDFGQLILLFSKRRLAGFECTIAQEAAIGADPAIVLKYRETGESMTIFEKKNAIRQTMQGELWVRKSDFLPLRITVITERLDEKFTVVTEATVDYAPTPHGVILPVSVMHRDTANGELLAENHFTYSAFKRFGAETELKFDIR